MQSHKPARYSNGSFIKISEFYSKPFPKAIGLYQHYKADYKPYAHEYDANPFGDYSYKQYKAQYK